MILVELKNGLGNQLFQYAFGRQLSILKKTELKLNISNCLDNKRNYLLDHFKISGVIATNDDYKKFYFNPQSYSSILKYNILNSFSPAMIVEETNFHEFKAEILKYSLRNLYLKGYWQNEKYFLGIEDIIRTDYQLSSTLPVKHRQILDQITRNNSVSIHFRRTDFIDYNRPIPPLSYYEDAVEYIKSKNHEAKFYIFSDDIEWVKNNFRIKYAVEYIDFSRNDDAPYDLELIKSCNHNIIANSSFSWWGAWLNSNPNKIVISPELAYWDRNSNSDFLPASWLKMK